MLRRMSGTFIARGRADVSRGPRRSNPADQLRFIRHAMEGAGAFTAVSGAGQVAVGGIGLLAATMAVRTSTPGRWLAVWLGAAVVAMTLSGWAIAHKAARLKVPLWSGPARRFATSFFPSLVAGAILTLLLIPTKLADRLPGVWLLVYGAGVTAGGAASLRLVPVMGACFMGLGTAALVAPANWGDGFMAFGFGVVHILFGIRIARRHGG